MARLIVLALVIGSFTATAQAQDVAVGATPSADVRDSIAQLSRQQIGSRYRLGAIRPGGAFDCSGLVKYVMSFFRVLLPRTAAEQAKLGVEVPRDSAQLLPGDILTFGRGRKITHVGIYIGDGRYVHASSRRRTVVETSLPPLTGKRGHWWKGVRRLLPSAAPDDSLPAAPEESPVIGSVQGSGL
jgi:cell wall-associated NlpC family hydrolase